MFKLRIFHFKNETFINLLTREQKKKKERNLLKREKFV